MMIRKLFSVKVFLDRAISILTRISQVFLMLMTLTLSSSHAQGAAGMGSVVEAGGSAGYQQYDWISSSLDALTTLFSECLEVPRFNLFNTGSVNLDASQAGTWVSANLQVQADKALEFTWNGDNVTKAPQKLFVMYRVDPRFLRPQLFILNYDYGKGTYVSDFHAFPASPTSSGSLPNCTCSCSSGLCADSSGSSTTALKCPYTCSKSSTASPTMLLPDCEANLANPAYFKQCMAAYSSYFSYPTSRAITVNNNDVISINLTTADAFFAAGSDFTQELDYNDRLAHVASIYTTTNLPDNQMIYASASAMCNTLFSGGTPPAGSQYGCTVANSAYLYNNLGSYPSLFLGLLDTGDILTSTAPPPSTPPSTITLPTTIYPCPVTQSISYTQSSAAPIYKAATSLCFYEGGLGMQVKLGGIINNSYSGFMNSPFTGNYFFYYQSNGSGKLDFTTDWMLGGSTLPVMFAGANPNTFMSSSPPYSTSPTPPLTPLQSFQNYIAASSMQTSGGLANYLHIGRYFMEIEIGGSSSLNANSTNNGVDVYYAITATNSPPSSTTPGSSTTLSAVNGKSTIKPGADGYVWLKVVNGNNTPVSGNIKVNYTNYTGSTVLSTTLNDYLIVPIISSIEALTLKMYSGLAGNATLHNIASMCLTLYVIFYGLYFLSGATQVKTMDLITRVIKIIVVVALFSKNSWSFFSDNFFNMLVGGISYLTNSVIGLTSNPDNIFGFLDIIFLKYLDLHLWRALGIQLLQLPSGLTFFALMVIAGIWIYFRAVLEVVIGYVMAYISMAVMICLAPIFITFMLFEKTKHLFSNWISALLNCMLQPTILLIFFLLIDQIMTQQLYGAVVECCWGWLINIEFTLSFKPALDFSLGPVPLPFLPGIPFFVPQVPNGDIINGINGAYLSIASSSIMFYCFAVMSKGLIGYVTNIIGILTSIGAVGVGVAGQGAAKAITADLQGEIQKDGTLKGGLRGKILGDVVRDEDGKMKRKGGIGGAIAGAGRYIKGKTLDQNYKADKEEDLKEKRLRDPDKGDDALRDKIANRSSRHDFKPR